MLNAFFGAFLITLALLAIRFEGFVIVVLTNGKYSDQGYVGKIFMITIALWWILLQFNF